MSANKYACVSLDICQHVWNCHLCVYICIRMHECVSVCVCTLHLRTLRYVRYISLCAIVVFAYFERVCPHACWHKRVCVCVCVITVLRLHSLCRMWRPSCLLTPEWMKQSGESHWELQFSLGSMTDPSLSTFTHTS